MCENDKYVFKLAFRLHAFLDIPEMIETHAHKYSIFNTITKLKCRKLFWSSHEIKIPRTLKIVQKEPHKIKMPQKVLC